MLEKTCYEFLDELASKAPVPGGGGACAYVASLGTALGSMVGNLTIGKKTYAAVQEDIAEMLQRSRKLMDRLNELVEEDANAFLPLSQAYRMPQDTPEQKKEKEEALQGALKEAAAVPLEIAQVCLQAIQLHWEYGQKGSRLALSDVGCGVVFCRAALQGAALNVLINLKLMKDQSLKKEMGERLESLVSQGCQIADQVFEQVREEIS